MTLTQHFSIMQPVIDALRPVNSVLENLDNTIHQHPVVSLIVIPIMGVIIFLLDVDIQMALNKRYIREDRPVSASLTAQRFTSDKGGGLVIRKSNNGEIAEVSGNVNLILEKSKVYTNRGLDTLHDKKFVAEFTKFLNEKYSDSQHDLFDNLDRDVSDMLLRLGL